MLTIHIDGNVRLNLEGDWPRSAYLQHCQQQGVDYTEEGYLQWRAVGERLTGEPCFETTVQRASDALASLGKTFAMIGPQMQAFVDDVQTQTHEAKRRSLPDADR